MDACVVPSERGSTSKSSPRTSPSLASAEPKRAQEPHGEGGEPWAEVLAAELGRKHRLRPLPAVRARERMGAVFGHVHPDREALNHLVEARCADCGRLCECVAAPAAGVGAVVDDRIDAFGRQQPAVATTVAFLAAARPFAPPLLRSLEVRRVGGGRLGRVRRVHAESGVESTDPLLEHDRGSRTAGDAASSCSTMLKRTRNMHVPGYSTTGLNGYRRRLHTVRHAIGAAVLRSDARAPTRSSPAGAGACMPSVPSSRLPYGCGRWFQPHCDYPGVPERADRLRHCLRKVTNQMRGPSQIAGMNW